MYSKHRFKIALICFGYLFFMTTLTFGQALTVEAAVEKDQVFVGESFIFQITVQGSEAPEQPVLKGFDDFTVAFLGGRTNSSQSITIINNKVQQQNSMSYIFQYSLTPKKTGRFILPSVMVIAEGRNLLTDPIQISVKEPTEVGDYKLRLSLSKSSCYIGEPVTLTITWYIGASVDNISFNIPVMDDKRFTIEEFNTNKNAAAQYVQMKVNNRPIEFEHPNATSNYQGKDYKTLSLKRVLIPQSKGQILIDKAFVEFAGVSGYKNVRDWFGGTQKQEVFTNFVIPSNTLSLDIKDVPTEGKPTNYSGLIGDKFTMEVSASPVDVKVGDPITLQLALSGPKYLNDAKIPDLNTIKPLFANFKIPTDQAPGKIDGNKKIFTQTLRAIGVEVTSIPEFEIPYFNTTKGKYEYLRSNPIPLKVEASEIKTFMDLEGVKPVEMKSELAAWNEGIAHNYEGNDLLKNQAVNLIVLFYNPLLIILLALPVLIFAILLYITRFSHIMRTDDTDKKYKKANSKILKVLEDVNKIPESKIYGVLIEELNRYLSHKLKIKSVVLSYKDVETHLKNHAISEEVLNQLQKIYQTCEAGHYSSGTFDKEQIGELTALIKKTILDIERSFKK